MRQLSKLGGETVILSVLSNGVAVCLERVESEKGIVFSMERGAHLPLHSGASAKILLAFLPDDEIRSFLKRNNLERYTDNTITAPEELWKNLMEIRRTGCAYSDQEVDVGARAVSAPIFNHENRMIAGLCVAGPVQRLDDKKIKELKKLVVEYAEKISAELK
jgi:DNA-binding IclR family transcriptional regulator